MDSTTLILGLLVILVFIGQKFFNYRRGGWGRAVDSYHVQPHFSKVKPDIRGSFIYWFERSAEGEKKQWSQSSSNAFDLFCTHQGLWLKPQLLEPFMGSVLIPWEDIIVIGSYKEVNLNNPMKIYVEKLDMYFGLPGEILARAEASGFALRKER